MIVYVESNFVLELALKQAEFQEVDEILHLAESKTIELAIPSLALHEPYSTIEKRSNDREEFIRRMNQTVSELNRNQDHLQVASQISTAAQSLSTIEAIEVDGLNGTIARIVDCGRVLEMSSLMIKRANAYKTQFGLKLKDSIILATCSIDLEQRSPQDDKLFLSRNTKDFSKQTIFSELKRTNCWFEGSFKKGLEYIKSHLL